MKPAAHKLAVVPSRQKRPRPTEVATKPAPPAAVVTPADIDRLGSLRARIEEHKARISQDVAEEAALSDKLLAAFAGEPGDAIRITEGERFLLKLSMRSNEQQYRPGAMRQIFNWIGEEEFFALADIGFTVLKTRLTAERYEQVVTKAHTGRRSLDLVQIAKPALAA